MTEPTPPRSSPFGRGLSPLRFDGPRAARARAEALAAVKRARREVLLLGR